MSVGPRAVSGVRDLRSPESAERAENGPGRDQWSGAARKRILLVEDDHSIREGLQQILEDEGYAVTTAENGRRALDDLLSGSVPDLIVLDLRMPIMDGWQFRTEQKADPVLASIPVLAISADGSAKASAIDAAAYLHKPLSAAAVLNAIRRILGDAQSSVAVPKWKPQPEAARIWGRILVIDDGPAIGQTISDALPEYDVTVVSAAGEAFARLVDDQRFDMILCDLMMPQLGGRDVLERLDAEWPHLAPRLIFITGGALTTAAREFLRRAKQMVLMKPFSVDQLRTTIAMHLETRSRESNW